MDIESMLVQGMESEKSIDLLISLTKIKSESVIDALKSLLCRRCSGKNGSRKKRIRKGQSIA